ncbi:MAG: arginyl-tRNA--protein-N-Asp/Glu arginylyltransferase [Flavobacteriales bacterium]|jgi:arginyl-tRNA--protein-N-Asp/Glu arginylyltransferase
MFTEIHYPQELFPEELDDYLAKGWFRMGQTIFTCRFITFEDVLFTTVWLRLTLDGFQFSKSQRKLMRKNQSQFSVISRKAIFNKEKEELYKIHRQRFSGHVAKTLRSSLFGDTSFNIYDTYEIAIYDGEQLVGCSFFDRGEKTLASIMGMFHPDYNKDSLGYYTMLEEIAYGQQQNYEEYYPGYVVPGYEKFDYKLRIGATDFYDEATNSWLPYRDLDHKSLLSNQIYHQLASVQIELKAKGIPHQLWLYPLFDKDLYGYPNEQFLRTPVFLSCFPKGIKKGMMVIVYDLYKKSFFILFVMNLEDPVSLLMPGFFKGFDKDKSYLDFLIPRKLLGSSNDPLTITETIERLL